MTLGVSLLLMGYLIGAALYYALIKFSLTHGKLKDQLTLVAEINPKGLALMMAFLTVAWPAAILYGILTLTVTKMNKARD